MSDTDSWIEIGTRLRDARKYLGLSQEDVANVMGLPRTAINKIENGKRKVDTVELANFARLYQQPVSVLAGEAEALPVPESVKALARTASELSDKDQEALLNFANFLRGQPPGGRDG